MKPTVSVQRTNKSRNLLSRLKNTTRKAVYVGIPTTTAQDRSEQLKNLAEATENKSEKTKLLAEAASNKVNNAELLYLFSKGSPLNNQPPREVIEPAIIADGNKQAIAHELAESSKATLDGNDAEAVKRLKRAGIAGENASKAWFSDPRNNWAPNSPRTVISKGSSQPGIDTSGMRNAITHVVKDETDE